MTDQVDTLIPIALKLGGHYPIPMPREGVIGEFFRNGNNILVSGMHNIKEVERRNFIEGRIKSALVVHKGLVAMLFKFGDLPWIEAVFNSLSVPPKEISIPRIQDPRDRLFFQLHLVELNTHTVAGLRAFTLSPAMSQRLVHFARQQLTMDWDPETAEAEYFDRQTKDWVSHAVLMTWCG